MTFFLLVFIYSTLFGDEPTINLHFILKILKLNGNKYDFYFTGGIKMFNFEELKEKVINGDQNKVKELVEKGLAEGIPAKDLIDKALIPAMDIVGEKFANNEFYIPELLIAARAMEGALTILRPKLEEGKVKPIAKVVIGTVKGDLHDIGKNIVASMLRGAGFEIIDLGIDVDENKFVEAAKGADIVALSALLTTTMPAMQTTIKALKKAKIRDKVKVMVGGAPLTQSYADEIGADGYSPDAASAVKKARELLGINK